MSPVAEQSRGKKAKGSVLSIRHTAVLSLSSKGSPVLPSAALNTSMGSTLCVCVCVCVYVCVCVCVCTVQNVSVSIDILS